MHSFYLDAIRRFEGFTQRAQWDYAQYSNGYGTRALYPGEAIDRSEAERRFCSEIANARALVERHAPNVDEGTKAALTSLTFNAGDKWARSGLGEAVRSGDLDTVRALFLEYNKAGGKELPGLSDRRAVEALWIGNSDAADGSTAASAATPYAVRVGAGPSTVGSVRPGIAAMALALANPADAQTPRSVAPAADTAPAADASAMQAAPLRASAETASPEVAALVRQLLGDAAAERARLGTQGLAPLADFARLRPPEEERDRARRSAADGIERA